MNAYVAGQRDDRYEPADAIRAELGQGDPFSVHMVVDVASGLLLAASPWLFGFADRIWWPHLVVGLIEIAVPLLTGRQPAFSH
jgi:hypothetical protein